MKTFILKNNSLVPQEKEFTHATKPIDASRVDALERLYTFDVKAYAKSRNSLDGGVSKLSIYVEHGLLAIDDFLEHIKNTQTSDVAEALLKQLYWREFFLQTYEAKRSKIWQDYEPYKTGYTASHYADTLPQDIFDAKTATPLIDLLVDELNATGYLHNHARLYLSSYIIHFRRVKWQAGALWMLERLHDGNVAVNNLSWQWVASTRSDKPYIFNWENIEKFAAKKYKLKREDHKIFDATYEELAQRLFLEGSQNV